MAAVTIAFLVIMGKHLQNRCWTVRLGGRGRRFHYAFNPRALFCSPNPYGRQSMAVENESAALF
jgi:hypothetical protein